MDECETEESEQGFAALPPETQRELKKLRNEAQTLRKRNEALSNEVLVSKYGEEIVDMIPTEITTFDRRVELAETYAERMNRPEPEPEAAAPVEEDLPPGLAAVATGVAAYRPIAPELMSVKQVKALAETDPVTAARLVMEGRYQKQEAL